MLGLSGQVPGGIDIIMGDGFLASLKALTLCVPALEQLYGLLEDVVEGLLGLGVGYVDRSGNGGSRQAHGQGMTSEYRYSPSVFAYQVVQVLSYLYGGVPVVSQGQD